MIGYILDYSHQTGTQLGIELSQFNEHQRSFRLEHHPRSPVQDQHGMGSLVSKPSHMAQQIDGQKQFLQYEAKFVQAFVCLDLHMQVYLVEL